MPCKVDLRGSFSLCFPLISRFSGLPAEGRFADSSLVAAPPSEQHFHPRTRRSFPAPFKITHCHRRRKTASAGRHSNYLHQYS